MDRITRYGGLKKRSTEVQGFLKALAAESPNDRRLKRLNTSLATCANYLVFHDYYTVDQLRLVKASTCKKTLLCPFCAARRAAKLVQSNMDKLESVIASHGSLKPVLLTLTVKNGDDLPERFRHLTAAYRKLQDRRRNALKGLTRTEFAKVRGGLHSFEFTNSGNGWHPHIHMVALVSDWIDQKALSAEWLQVTGDSMIVDIRAIRNDPDSLASGMLEVFKYALKFQDMDLSNIWTAFQALSGRRLVGSFGLLRGIKLPESLLDDELDGLPFLEMFYRYQRNLGAYTLDRSTNSETGETFDQRDLPPP